MLFLFAMPYFLFQTNEGEWNIQTNHLSFANFDFTLSYHALPSAKASQVYSHEHKKEHGKEGSYS